MLLTTQDRRPTPLAFLPHAQAPDLWLDVNRIERPPLFASGEPHRPDFFEVLLILRGTGRIQRGSEGVKLEPGSLVLAPAGETIRLDMAPRTERFVLCLKEDFFTGPLEPFLLQRLALFGRCGGDRVLQLGIKDRGWLEERMTSMAEEMRVLDGKSRTILAAQLIETLFRMERIVQDTLPTGLKGRGQPWAERCLEVLEETFRKSHRVEDLADRLHLSPARLHSLATHHLGRSPKRLISDRLKIEAKRLLERSENSSAQIATRLGFSDPSYFARCFSRWTGQSPTAYRNSCQKEKVPEFKRN